MGDARAVPGRDASGAAGVRLEAAGAAGDAATGRAAREPRGRLEQCVRAGGRREIVSGEWSDHGPTSHTSSRAMPYPRYPTRNTPVPYPQYPWYLTRNTPGTLPALSPVPGIAREEMVG